VAALVLATMAAGIALAGAAGAWFVAGLWHLALAGAGLAFARRWTRLPLLPARLRAPRGRVLPPRGERGVGGARLRRVRASP
jgi:hypothetical protein